MIIAFLDAAYFIFLIGITRAFNIDVGIPIIKTQSGNFSFGFSLIGHTLMNNERGILVGAPRAGTNGEVFFCSFEGSTCEKVIVDVADLARTNDEYTEALFGFAIATTNETHPSSIKICAPRITRISVSLVYITGGCFEIDPSLQKSTFILPSMSLCQEIPEGESKIDLRHCTMGASVGLHPSAPNEVYMGGPYFHYAKGIGAMIDVEHFTKVQTTVDGLLPNTQLGSALDLSDRIYQPTSGVDKPLHVAYGGPGVPVIDSTEQTLGAGMVLIYSALSNEHGSSIRPVLRLNGNKFGSRFGHSLIFVDLNGDGWDDLIVGAPYQKLEALAGSAPDYGAVFVFINQQSNFSHPVHDLEGLSPFAYHPESAYQIITPVGINHGCGSSSLSGYGSTLGKIGDINHDGYQDFAVGAPYTEGGGVVFIYHGSKSGKITVPTQAICMSRLPMNTPLDGLGFSVGLRGFDLDKNGYADLAIGAPLTDSVLILRTRPVVKLQAHVTLADGSTSIKPDLKSLPLCTKSEEAVSGYKGIDVRCLDLKVFMTYTSVDGYACDHTKRYKVSMLLKFDPNKQWLESIDAPEQMRNNAFDINSCPGASSSNVSSEIFKVLSIAPVSFLGEKSLDEYGLEAGKYFQFNDSLNSLGLSSPGGFKPVEVQATCQETLSTDGKYKPTQEQLRNAKNLRLLFRDINIVDRTKPLSIGVRWLAEFPRPGPGASDLNKFPIADPRQNNQLIELPFENQCVDKVCCGNIRVEYDVTVSRDKFGPVVYVGDDTNQVISIRARVVNIGRDPVYGLNFVSLYPSNLLELNNSDNPGNRISPEAAICNLANPLAPGQTTECSIKWQVIGHQLTVQLANFSVNSTIITGTGIPIRVEGSLKHELTVRIKMLAKVSVEGSIEPNTVYFSKNVTDGISSITAENQIGDSRLLIKITVRNLLRHSLIPDSRIIIDWPYEIAGNLNETHGKYLLYLLEVPSVVKQQLSIINSSSVTCDSRVLEKLVNPHNYRVFPFLKISAGSVPVLLAPVDLPSSHPNNYPPLVSSLHVEHVPERLNDSASEAAKRKMTTISCYNGQLRCLPITCDLGKLSYKAGPVTLEFSARLWDNTLRQDFKEIFQTKLQLTATWRADVKYSIDLGDSDHAQNSLELSIFNNLEPKPIVPKYMALYIGLAVFGGVLLLAVLIIILQKAGFFKRKRFVRRPRKLKTDGGDTDSGSQQMSRTQRQSQQRGTVGTKGSKSRQKDSSGFEALQPDTRQRGTYRAVR